MRICIRELEMMEMALWEGIIFFNIFFYLAHIFILFNRALFN